MWMGAKISFTPHRFWTATKCERSTARSVIWPCVLWAKPDDVPEVHSCKKPKINFRAMWRACEANLCQPVCIVWDQVRVRQPILMKHSKIHFRFFDRRYWCNCCFGRFIDSSERCIVNARSRFAHWKPWSVVEHWWPMELAQCINVAKHSQRIQSESDGLFETRFMDVPFG